MFDHRYTEQLEELKRLAAAYSSWVRSVGEVIEDWSAESISYLDEAAYQKALGSLNAINGVNERLLEQKLGAPSESVAMSASKAPIDALNAVISEANTKIDAHNRLVESQKRRSLSWPQSAGPT